MKLSSFFQSVIEQDLCAVVICDLSHKILYMNPAAVKRYAKNGGAALVGRSLLDCHNARSREMIERVVAWFGERRENNRVFTTHNERENKDVYMVALREEDGTLIGYYEKHEYRNRETASAYDFGAQGAERI